MLRVVLGMYNLYSGVRKPLKGRYWLFQSVVSVQNMIYKILCIFAILYILLCIVFINLYSYRFNKGKI